MKRNIIIDCDPGVDDCLALIIASKIKEINIVGICTVSGNLSIDITTKNALDVVSLIKKEYKVYQGSVKPLIREALYAKQQHGSNGLMGEVLQTSDQKTEKISASDFIYQKAKELKGNVEILAIGPLTNIAQTIIRYPEIESLIKCITIMGGSILSGNVTNNAEFNIYCDPHAAKIVFNSSIRKNLVPLDVTHKAYINDEEIIELSLIDSKTVQLCCRLMKHTKMWSIKHGLNSAVLHDVTALIYAYKPELYTTNEAWVTIETQSELTMGKTIIDFDTKNNNKKNCRIVLDVDRKEYFLIIKKLLKQFEK